jgi:hypothetical protein
MKQWTNPLTVSESMAEEKKEYGVLQDGTTAYSTRLKKHFYRTNY